MEKFNLPFVTLLMRGRILNVLNKSLEDIETDIVTSHYTTHEDTVELVVLHPSGHSRDLRLPFCTNDSDSEGIAVCGYH